MKRAILLWVCMILVFAQAATAQTTITVGKGGGFDYDTIQAAINAATKGDTVVVYPGTYIENIQFTGKDITLRSTNPTSPAVVAATIIDGNRSGTVVTFRGFETSSCVLSGFTIRNGNGDWGGGIRGNATGATIQYNWIANNRALRISSWSRGGGIAYCRGTIQNNTVTLNAAYCGGGLGDCYGMIQANTITNNIAGIGGGLYDCRGTICNNTIADNSTSDSGGGLIGCSGLIASNTITGNSAISDGGGLLGCGDLILSNRISGNTSRWGGGLARCSGTIENNTITRNTAKVDGGGLDSCYAVIQNNMISHNSAWNNGGGIFACRGTIQNNMILQNSAGINGGGISDCGSLIRNSTIVGNSASFGIGGMRHFNGAIVNCIICGNNGSELSEIDDFGTPTYSCIQGWTRGGLGNISADPLFTPGPLGGYYLSQTAAGQTIQSPCVDAGSSLAIELNLDAGITRTDGVTDTGTVDMGYHYPATLFPPIIAVQPSRFNLIIPAESQTTTQPLVVWNIGGGTLQYDVQTTPSGLFSIRPTSGQSQGERIRHDVSFATSHLSSGTYKGQILITGNALNSPTKIPVEIDIYFLPESEPVIVASPTSFSLTVPMGTQADTRTLLVSNKSAGPSTLTYTIAAVPSTVIGVNPASGQSMGGMLCGCIAASPSEAAEMSGELPTPSGDMPFGQTDSAPTISGSATKLCISTNKHVVSFNTASLSPGLHTGHIVITGNATNSPTSIPVSITIVGQPPPQTITVGKGGGYDFDTIQAAIDAATTGDTVVVYPGTYLEAISFLGKSIILRSTDPTSAAVVAATIIDGKAVPGASVVTFTGTETTSCVLSGFTIRNGQGGYHGGGIVGEGTRARIENNAIVGNWASDMGGGIYGCNGIIQNNSISGNQAPFGGNGLAYCHGLMQNNMIVGNLGFGPGGGLFACNGVIRNNLITRNHVSSGASGLSGCVATIANNTIVDNVSEDQEGGLSYCYGTIVNCIIWGNQSLGASQISESTTPTYSCIQGGTGVGNINADPQFVVGPLGGYYLSQTAAGQSAQSPCVDAGSTAALALGLADRTTRTDGIADEGAVDMGYHYGGAVLSQAAVATSPTQFDLTMAAESQTTRVLEVWNSGTGTLRYQFTIALDGLVRGVVPLSGQSSGEHNRHTVLFSTAGYGPGMYATSIAVDGNSHTLTASIPVNITVSSGPVRTITVGKGGGYDHDTIQAAIDAATTGDTVLVHPASYIENIHFRGKSIAVRSTNPPDPSTAAATIIDGGQTGPVVTFAGTETSSCVLAGFTIQNGRSDLSAAGGGIRGNGALARIEYNTITSNQSNVGAGIWRCDGTIRHNEITRNNPLDINGQGSGLLGCHGTIENNLIYDNGVMFPMAGFGGTVRSCNGTLRNNSISHNKAIGLISCQGTITNCILWMNHLEQIVLSTTPTYSCIQNWTAGGLGNITANPQFVVGPYGVHYLGQTAAGQSVQSPCVDAGSSTALEVGLADRTTRTDGAADTGIVDMGYHYPSISLPPTIVTSPGWFAAWAPEGSQAPSAMLEVKNGGGGSLVYDIITSPSWLLSVTPLSGQSSGEASTHTVVFHTAALSAGVYSGDIVIQGNAANSPVHAPVAVTVVANPLPDFIFRTADFAPIAPTQLHPGDPISLNTYLANVGFADTKPCWLEVWGSRTGGLTLDRFLGTSFRLPYAVTPGGICSWITTEPLYSIPDGPYTVVYAVDRLGEMVESNRRNNRMAVLGKRLLVIRPQTQADLAVEGFGMSPNPALAGQSVAFSGRVVNRGAEPSGPFWIEFWGSWNWPYPNLDFFLCDSIWMANLDPGAAVELSAYARRLYNVPTGVFMIGCVADRDDSVNELDETNNYQFVDGQVFNSVALYGRNRKAQALVGADVVVVSADISPVAPVQSAPGDTITLTVELANLGTANTGPFWLEYWGSRDGGLTLCDFLTVSDYIADLAPGARVQLASVKPLWSIPDGPYSVVVFADRPNNVDETDEGNNRRVIAGRRLLVVRPATGANLVLGYFTCTPGQWPNVGMGGYVHNNGTAESGPFWIEFWITPGDPDYPWLDRYACDSIHVDNLAVGQTLYLNDYARTFYASIPGGEYAVIGFVDRLDQVIETDETDNYRIVRRVVVPAH